MFTLRETSSYSQDIKKSRFIATCGPVGSEEEARGFIAAHSDLTASHNCWAWRIAQAYRFSDDGEPRGTAGKPMLQAIDGQALDNVAVVVTRWFGGILLGSGGLMRAYGGTAATCMRFAAKTELIVLMAGTITCDFADLALLKARLGSTTGLHIDGEEFSATGATLSLRMPTEMLNAAETLATDITRGKALIKFGS